MKLNNSHRSAFVRSVMNDIPVTPIEKAYDEVLTKLKTYVDSTLPPEIQKLLGGPAERYLNINIIGTHSLQSCFTVSGRMIHLDFPQEMTNRTKQITYVVQRSESSYMASAFSSIAQAMKASNCDLSRDASQSYEKLKHLLEERTAVHRKVDAYIKGMTTWKQVADANPEFIKYLPRKVDEKTDYPLAVLPIIGDLRSAGWTPPGTPRTV